MNVLTFLNSMRPALPMSAEHPCTPVSNSELRRWIKSGSVLIDGKRVDWGAKMSFPVESIVFFPSSTKRRTTVW